MSAFAAILMFDGNAAAAHAESAAVSSALGSVTGTLVGAWRSGPCQLLVAPLHAWEPRAPVTVDNARLAAAGQVTLEARADLARALQLAPGASDLEAVAAAFDRWGLKYAEHLRGEYSCAVWDSRERRLSCARDPLGIRPLYVGRSSRVVVVSNVIDAVVAHPAVSEELDDAALTRFLAQGTLTTAVATPYKAVRMLHEGHTLTIAYSGRVTLTRHWQPPSPPRSRERNDEFFASGYRDVLRSAVRDRIGGRPCTIFLSGGMDSTSLAVLGVGCASDMRAITFAYQRVDVPGEVPLARSVAERLSLPLDVIHGDAHLALEAERTGDIPALPVDEPSLTNWRAGLRAAASFSTLAVYGEDGDALFAPPGGAALLAAQSVPSLVRTTLRSLATERRLPYLGIRLRERLGWMKPRPLAEATWLTAKARQLASTPDELTLLGAPLQPLDFEPGTGRAWERLLRNVPRTFAISISPDVTRQRLALTLPLMDTRVIEFVMSVPPIPWCDDKRLARTAFAGRLPSAVLTRRKTPADALHATLVDSWRTRHLPMALHSMAPAMAATGWVDSERWTEAVERGAPDAALAAWRVLLLDAWLSRMSRKVPCTT